ncbi:hypothetical protein GCM10009641_63580 [Mycobacterium cookii]|uniref:Polyketide cyclase n=2 Tax=Mycobacterium cookii TaxID=1775 RepID=A0A7I7KX40_9MYCO|nr:hypothetical protein MCOO_19270 [Mycobacterium cookii]
MALAMDSRTSQTGVMKYASRRLTEIAGLVAVLYAARRYYRNWGTSKGECQARLSGDELIGDPVIQVTEAVWIDSPPSVTWPWLLQMGQDRDGLHSRRALENVVGLRMHDPDGPNPEWKQLAVGDTLQLKPKGWMGLPGGLSLRIDEITPGQSIVLRATSPDLPSVVWSFHLQPHWATHTRLLARVRIGLRHPGEVVAVELVRPVIALVLRKVLLNIKRRVERQTNDLTTVDFAP